jgi:hypothetical protein
MRSTRVMLSLILLAIAAAAYAQTDAKKAQPQTEAQKSFAILKSLAGTWEGPVTMTGETHEHAKGVPDSIRISLRVTSRGNALVHEMGEPKPGEDPTKYDHPVTMFYLDEGRLLLTHYCDAGNRPRMVSKVSEDGKKIEFDFLDVAGPVQYGHMYHAVFTIIDANHHIEEWTFKLPGDKVMGGRMELQRVQPKEVASR